MLQSNQLFAPSLTHETRQTGREGGGEMKDIWVGGVKEETRASGQQENKPWMTDGKMAYSSNRGMEKMEGGFGMGHYNYIYLR